MKIIKRVLLFSLVLTMLLGLAVPASALTVNELLTTASEKLDAAKSFEMDAAMDIALSDATATLTGRITGKLSYIADPLKYKSKAVLVIDAVGANGEKLADYGLEKFKLSMGAYAEQAGDELVTYFEFDGNVTKSSVPLTEADDFNPSLGGGFDSLRASAINFSYDGKKIINKTVCYVVNCELDTKLLEKSMGGDALASAVPEASEYSEQLAALPNIKVTYYINVETHEFCRIDMDMADILNGILKMDAGMDDEDGITIGKALISVSFKNYNKVKKFSIPASVKKAANKNTLW